MVLRRIFFEVAIVDLLINNNDRNEDNWGVVKDKATEKCRFSPVYDCGNSFSGKASEEKIAAMLSDPAKLVASALNGVTAFEDDSGNRITNAQFINVDCPELKKAIVAVSEKISGKLTEIENFISSIPHEFKGTPIISENRAKYYIMGLKARYEMMIRPKCEEILKKETLKKG